MEHKITVVGIGPGSPDYVLPVAKRIIEKAQVLIGSKRVLASFANPTAKTFVIDKQLDKLMENIHNELQTADVVVMVSGDPGFYSLLAALKREFSNTGLEVIPGVSSMQVAFARLQATWHDAALISLHGRSVGSEELAYSTGRKLAFLTDGLNNPGAIAARLLSYGWPGESTAHILTNLSYESEQHVETSLQELTQIAGYEHSVMVVIA